MFPCAGSVCCSAPKSHTRSHISTSTQHLNKTQQTHHQNWKSIASAEQLMYSKISAAVSSAAKQLNMSAATGDQQTPAAAAALQSRRASTAQPCTPAAATEASSYSSLATLRLDWQSECVYKAVAGEMSYTDKLSDG